MKWNELRSKLDDLIFKELGEDFYSEKWRLDGFGNNLMLVLHEHWKAK